ncbi:MAG: hypothetical protein DRI40_01580 [Chloroflexi bacterium]|nr:MAG: hypothetical protein DRI40_01580 [Chloroflexota bacterium]
MHEDTFPGLLHRNSRQWDDQRVALRKKQYGLWKEYTWRQCYEKVRACSLGLLALGLDSGDRVCILGDTTPEWFWSQLAAQAVAGIAVGLSPGASGEEAAYVLADSQAKFVLAQDQEQVDKLLGIRDRLPALRRIVYWDDRGLRRYNDGMLVSLSEMIRLGEEADASHPGRFDERLRSVNSDDVAIVLYAAVAGEQADPLPLSHRFLLSCVQAAQSLHTVFPGEEYVSMAFPGWFFEQIFGFGNWLLAGQTVNFAERVETATTDMREVSPHVLVYPSQVWEAIATAINTGVGNGVWLKRTLFRWAMSLAYAQANSPAPRGQAPLLRRLLRRIAEIAVFRPLRDKHGFDRLRVAFAAGSPLSPDTLRFFNAIGVNVVQVFGSSRDGIVTEQPDEHLRIE